MTPDLNTLSMDLTGMLLPWIAVLISLVIAIWFKDFATGLAKGLKFKWDPAFKEGDEVSVKVVGFDRGKVKLSMKQASA